MYIYIYIYTHIHMFHRPVALTLPMSVIREDYVTSGCPEAGSHAPASL